MLAFFDHFRLLASSRCSAKSLLGPFSSSHDSHRVLLTFFRLRGQVLFLFRRRFPFTTIFIPAVRFHCGKRRESVAGRCHKEIKRRIIISVHCINFQSKFMRFISSFFIFWAHLSFFHCFVRFSCGNGANCCSRRPQKKVKRPGSPCRGCPGVPLIPRNGVVPELSTNSSSRGLFLPLHLWAWSQKAL